MMARMMAGTYWTPTAMIQPDSSSSATARPIPAPIMLPRVVMHMSEPVKSPRSVCGAISAWYDGTAFSMMPTVK